MPTAHDDFTTWTAGAQRVWQSAQNLAIAQEAAELALEHVLWGLLSHENRAAERLTIAGVSLQAYQQMWGPVAESEEQTSQIMATTLPRHDLVETVLIEARTDAFREGAGTELGTEHLLAALCRVESPVSDWLAQFAWNVEPRRDASQISSSAEPTPSLVTSPELTTPWLDPTQHELSEIYRILDAAGNRTREGLRVVEDYVRWAWNDGFLAQQLKECRHVLTDVLRRFPLPLLIASRDTIQDVGTEIRTASEYRRGSPAEVATASLKRVQEALRSLEEYSKVVDAELSPRLEQLRYRIYTLEKAISTTHRARARLTDQHLCLLATSSLCHHGIGPAILGALEAGVRMIQLREKTMSTRELLELAQHVRRWTREFNALFILNDRVDLAIAAQADGVHLGQDDLSVAEARKLLGSEKLIGVSTHGIEQARQAVIEGADYLGVGPVFPSSTKSFETFPGLNFVREVAAEISLPWFAIGGITLERIPELVAAGASRIAVSGVICSAEHPSATSQELLHGLSFVS